MAEWVVCSHRSQSSVSNLICRKLYFFTSSDQGHPSQENPTTFSRDWFAPLACVCVFASQNVAPKVNTPQAANLLGIDNSNVATAVAALLLSFCQQNENVDVPMPLTLSLPFFLCQWQLPCQLPPQINPV